MIEFHFFCLSCYLHLCWKLITFSDFLLTWPTLILLDFYNFLIPRRTSNFELPFPRHFFFFEFLFSDLKVLWSYCVFDGSVNTNWVAGVFKWKAFLIRLSFKDVLTNLTSIGLFLDYVFSFFGSMVLWLASMVSFFGMFLDYVFSFYGYITLICYEFFNFG